jgi:hypothetical protein
MEQAKRSTESWGRFPLLLGLAVVLGAALLWDRWAGWSIESAPGSGGASGPPIAADREAGSRAGGKPGADAADGGAAHPLADLALGELRDTLRRPLFERTRRPVEPPPRAAPAAIPGPGADPQALTLLGVLKSDGGDAIALLRRNPSGQNVRLQEGETVDGWTVERIEADTVVLKQGDTSIALQLFARR